MNLSLTQDYGFEYSDDDAGGEPSTADVENLYYKAKGLFDHCSLMDIV